MTGKQGYFNTGIYNYRIWLKQDWSPYQLAAWYRWNRDNWKLVKILLKHKNLPECIRKKYVESNLWYERLVAMLAKPVRAKYIKRALSDPNRIVRQSAIYGFHQIGTLQLYLECREQILEEYTYAWRRHRNRSHVTASIKLLDEGLLEEYTEKAEYEQQWEGLL